VPVRDAGEGERVAAEAYAAGATGLEEREAESGIALWLYVPTGRVDAVRGALAAALGSEAPPAEPVPDQDWATGWRAGLGPVQVSPRLVIRPSFAERVLGPGQHELVIDPGQAFGTGTHESTRLVLEWIDALADGLAPGCRLLDVGTGTGILALALRRLAPRVSVVALDLDPLATEAARENARSNALPDLALLAGGLDAIAAGPRFDGILANLVRSERAPLIDAIAERLRPEGFAVFAGLLEADRDRIEALAQAEGLASEGVRAATDANGERWIALLMRRAPGSASGRSGARGSSGTGPRASSP